MPRLHLSQRLACVASQPNGVKRHCSMKPLGQGGQLGLASPLKYAAIQSGKTKSPSSKETGLDASYQPRVPSRGTEKKFFLTSSFIG